METGLMAEEEFPHYRALLNFTVSDQGDDGEPCFKKSRGTHRDLTSHRVIEKRRRDRMNNCLAELSTLIPHKYHKQGHGRVEKTEIIEMAVGYIKHLKDRTEMLESVGNVGPSVIQVEVGYQECKKDVMHFLMDRQGHDAADPLCVNLHNHLNDQLKALQTRMDHMFPPTHASDADSKKDIKKCLITPDAESVSAKLSPEGGTLIKTPNKQQQQQQQQHEQSQKTESFLGKVPNFPPTRQYFDKNLMCMLKGRNLASQSEENMDAYSMASSSVALSYFHDLRGDRGESIEDNSSMGQTGEELHQSSESDKAGKSSGAGYKYKSDIKLRFISNSEKEARPSVNTGLLDKFKNNDTSSDQTSNSYPSSEFSNGITCKNGSSTSGSSSNGSSSSPSVTSASGTTAPTATLDLSTGVPGFALHPAGTYYIPIVTPMSMIAPFLQNCPSVGGICHPISIPINFGGQLLSMQNIRVVQNASGVNVNEPTKERSGHSCRSGHSSHSRR